MALFHPFRPVRYAGWVGDVESLVAPPYDVISPPQRDILARFPYNIVHVTLPREPAEGAAVFRRWLEEGVLVRDDVPQFLVWRHRYTVDGVSSCRLGIVAMVDLEEAEGRVLRHERIRKRVSREREMLTEMCGAYLEPVFLALDAGGRLRAVLEDVERNAEGVYAFDYDDQHHELGRVVSPGDHGALREVLEDGTLVIADGHHRFRASLNLYRRRGKNVGWRWTRFLPALVVDTGDPGMCVLPIHRLVKGRIGDCSSVRGEVVLEPVSSPRAGRVRLSEDEEAVAVMVSSRGTFVVKSAAKEGMLPVEFLEQRVLPVVFEHVDEVEFADDTERVEACAGADDGTVGFLLRPVGVDVIVSRAKEGRMMPPKSTFFFPKPLSGLFVAKEE